MGLSREGVKLCFNPYSAGTDYIHVFTFSITILPISFKNIEAKT